MSDSSPNPFTITTVEDSTSQVAEFTRQMNEVINAIDKPVGDRIAALARMKAHFMPLLFQEAIAVNPSADRSVVIARAMHGIRDLTNMLVKKRELELSEEVDLHNPKFQIVLRWFVETVEQTLREDHQLPADKVNIFLDNLSGRLVDWEETCNKRLKGVAFKALSEIENPFKR